jgi:hypothetical protein
MHATIAALLISSLTLAGPLAQAADPDPTERAITQGWYRISMGSKTFERCCLDATALPSSTDDVGECRKVKQVQQGEQFEVVQSCQFDEDTLTIRVSGVARPGYFKAKTEFVEVPEEMREFFKGSLTMEAQRLRDCSAAELSKAQQELATIKEAAGSD